LSGGPALRDQRQKLGASQRNENYRRDEQIAF